MEIVAALVAGIVIGGLLVRQFTSASLGHDTRLTNGQHVAAVSPVVPNPDDRLVGALSALPLGLVVTDADGSILFQNAVAADFDSGRHTDAIVTGALAEVISSACNGSQMERELDLYGPPRRFLAVRGSPIVDVTGTNGAMVIIEDVTEIQRVRNLRRDFVANVSHELKTPVGAIGLLAETLTDETDPDVSERLARRLQTESIRLGSTIDDLLTLSEIEAGEGHDRAAVSMQSVVQSSVERLASAAEMRKIEIRVEQPSDDLTVLGDRRQLISAASNLLDNAIKYSDEGSMVDIGLAAAEGWIQLTVADRGVGIPESDIERVFERFYRVDPARSRTTGGTGLGLSIVRHVVLNHDGEITVDSREGEGSLFTLTIRQAPVALANGRG